MKADEFVTEGPLDRIKGAVQGYKSGGLTGAAAGFQAGGGAAVTDRRTADTANRVFNTWSQQLKALPAGSDIAAALKDFAEVTFKDDVPPGTTKVPDPQTPLDPTDFGKMKEYLTQRSKEVFGPKPQSQIPTTYGFPKQDTTVNIKGNDYKFDSSSRQWTDENFRPVVIPADIDLLNKTAYDAASNKSQAQQQSPSAKLRSHRSSRPANTTAAANPPTADSIVAGIPANLARDVISKLLQRYGTSGNPRP